MISTVKELCAALGGPAETGKLTGAGMKNPYVWICRDHIPYRWRLPLAREAEKRGLKLDPRLLETEAA